MSIPGKQPYPNVVLEISISTLAIVAKRSHIQPLLATSYWCLGGPTHQPHGIHRANGYPTQLHLKRNSSGRKTTTTTTTTQLRDFSQAFFPYQKKTSGFPLPKKWTLPTNLIMDALLPWSELPNQHVQHQQ